ncbi:MAG TPA: cell division protein ZapA [Bacteroidota bacterium]|jgi:cell division protein ZapA|nr:cell division protein ZapA [Bacteroidota bacterium]
MELKSIRVKIYGTEYPLKGEDEELMRQAAAYVDSLMQTFSEKMPQQTPSTLAVLTALNIAEELLKYKNQSKLSLEEAEREINSISEKIKLFLDTSSEDIG